MWTYLRRQNLYQLPGLLQTFSDFFAILSYDTEACYTISLHGQLSVHRSANKKITSGIDYHLENKKTHKCVIEGII